MRGRCGTSQNGADRERHLQKHPWLRAKPLFKPTRWGQKGSVLTGSTEAHASQLPRQTVSRSRARAAPTPLRVRGSRGQSRTRYGKIAASTTLCPSRPWEGAPPPRAQLSKARAGRPLAQCAVSTERLLHSMQSEHQTPKQLRTLKVIHSGGEGTSGALLLLIVTLEFFLN